MFTEVYYKCLAFEMAKTYVSSANFEAKDFQGNVRTISTNAQKCVENISSALLNFRLNDKMSFNGYGVAFGDGDATPTIDDYCLQGKHFTTYSATGAISYNPDTCTTTVLYTLTNTGSESFTIKEVGVFIDPYYNHLVMREVLDSPVTIPAGGIGQVTLKIKVNAPA